MMHFNKLLEKTATGKNVLGFFIITNLVYAFMLLVTIPRTMEFCNGIKLLDMMPTGYDFDYVNKLFIALGDHGRNFYLTNQIPVDMVYPLLFAITYSILLAYFLKKLNKLKQPYIYLCCLPIIGGIADYFENIGIIVMLKDYPNLTENIVSLTNVFSVTKSIATSIYFVILIAILILIGIKSLKRS